MNVLLMIVFGILAVLLQWVIAKEFFVAANAKGYHERKYFWFCFYLSLVGYLLIIALPNRGESDSIVSEELPEL